MEQLLISITDAARLAGVGRTVAYQLAHSQQWPVVKIGRSVRINRRRLEEWVEEQTRFAGSEAEVRG